MKQELNSVPSEEQIAVTPFGEIAVALSGGGFRAAAYSLGCLSYLERVLYDDKPLLKNVRFVSSASGGSITALYYALETANGKSFQDIFSSLFDFLKNSNGVESAFKKLRADSSWRDRPQKGRNLINAFALTYDELLFKGAELKDVVSSQVSHLDEICINATEFNYGITFRFHTGSGKVGNEPVSVRKETALAFKLGDILAASSCFPMGFEPIILPDDFAHKNLSASDIRDATTGKSTVGLMDGGITDNQGIYSFLLAEERKINRDKKGFDLFIYCDVASPYMESYTLLKEKKKLFGRISIQGYLNVFKTAPLLLAICLFIVIKFTASWWMIVFTTLSALFACTYLAALFFYLKVKKNAWKERSTWLITIFKYINELLFTRSSAIIQMLMARIKSSGILVGDVYLKQIRRLTIKSLYQNVESSPKWRKHAIGNFIYELSSINKSRLSKSCGDLTDVNGKPIDLNPSPEITKVADLARTMDTTLWFDDFQMEEGRREALIATGQFTTCFNLIEYLCALEKDKLITPELRKFQQSLIEDWYRFNANPLFISTPKAYKPMTLSNR